MRHLKNFDSINETLELIIDGDDGDLTQSKLDNLLQGYDPKFLGKKNLFFDDITFHYKFKTPADRKAAIEDLKNAGYHSK